MNTKKSFSFDEKADAEKIIQEGFQNGIINPVDMYLVAKYYRHEFGFGAVRLEKELINFCEANDPNFNPITEADQIKKWIDASMKFGLRKIEKIDITQKEIDFLNFILNERDKKILFAILIMAKALKGSSTRVKSIEKASSDNYYISQTVFRDIMLLSGLSKVTEIDVALVVYKYREFFTIYTPEKALYKVNFIDKDSKPILTITDFDRVSEYYDELFKKIVPEVKHYCQRCEKEIVEKKGRNQKYCEECSTTIRKEKERERQKSIYEKKKNSTHF